MIVVFLSVKRSDYDVNVQEDINTLNYFIKDCSKFLKENNIVLLTDKQSILGISELKYLSRFSLMTSISRFPERNFSKFLEVSLIFSVFAAGLSLILFDVDPCVG